jgi:hypothetical protein
MSLTHRSKLLTTVLVVVIAGATAVACSKAGSGGGGGASGKVEGVAKASLDVLPKETAFLGGVTWSKLKNNKWLKNAMQRMPPDSRQMLDNLKSTCNIDLINDIDSVVIAAGADVQESQTHLAFLVKGNFTKDKVADCVAKAPGGQKITVTEDGKLTTYTQEGKQPVTLAWVGKDTFLTTPSAMEGDKSYLSDLLKQKSTLKDNAAVTDLLNRCDTTASLWGAGLAVGPVAAAATQLPPEAGKLQGVWLTVQLDSGLQLYLGARLDKNAKDLADRTNRELEEARKKPQAAEFLKNVDVKADGNDLLVKAALTDEQLQKLFAMLKPFLNMMGLGM